MSENQNLTKEQLLKTIEQLEKNPNDKVGILADVGATALGAVGLGGLAAAIGTTTASIPIITAITGIGMFVAATPAVVVGGAAVAGGAAAYGVARLIKNGGFNEGKRKQLLNELKERLRETEAKERQSNFDEGDKTKFHLFLKEPLKDNLISPDDAHRLMQAVENGQIPLSEAYKLVGQIFSPSQTTEPEKVIIPCPKCSQKLRAPSNLGQLNLTCPKCKHSWSWVSR
ncbi:hypothetical protein [Cylindrospermum sp. FACHB-282]|uniref:hypothetical protein n=1 Tax=Cylindrospermum sp. FACHB-282 TaxID=2692794 RepID=UPI001686C72E|nr:hypothetical protein [Cylindrospermum sp. FACHB-282]MBD2385236.1 hypothetical protein [Cylindrospermum sp. FACHB-282]